MDDIAKYNQARWKALVEADALFTRPKLNLDHISAKELVDPHNRFGEIKDKNVLCLASGGGQQSAAFALLGANVTVFDISTEQLERDEEIGIHYGIDIKIAQGDMRDLSVFEQDSFDIVYHPYSLNFVPDAREVFEQVAKTLKFGGTYYFSCANPFVMGIDQKDWNGEGYVLKKPYLSKAEITYDDQDWVYDKDNSQPIPNPKEFRHTLSNLINGLIDSGFRVQHLSDKDNFHPNLNDEPATWSHFSAYAPPWLSIWAAYDPDLKV
jgi:2-polyprenyl-3-methyl-5-hydroxy-6-metoxy-1,4-benzoquinol methylase